MLTHPLVVHAPLIFLPTAIVICLVGWLSPWKQLKLVGIALLLAASVTSVIASNLGEKDEHVVERQQPWAEDIGATGLVQTVGGDELLDAHAELGELTRSFAILLTVAGVALIVFERRMPTLAARVEKPAVALLGLVGAAAVIVVVLTGHSGGTLVHEHGIGILVTPGVGAETRTDGGDRDADVDESGMRLPSGSVGLAS